MAGERIIQLTISGKDAGGYIFENVQHVQAIPGVDDDDPTILNALIDRVETTVLDAYLAAMNESSSILNIGAKFISPTPGYTVNRPHNDAGLQAGDPSVGALCGKVSFLPAEGFRVGRIFVAGPIDGNFTNDQATDAYITLLQAVGDAFLALTDAGGATWVFGLWTKKVSVFTPLVFAQAIGSPGVLSKRIRV